MQRNQENNSMKQKLFREEALEQYSSRLYGRVLVLPRGSHTVVVAFFALWLVLALSWFFISDYTHQQTVNGWLEPSAPAAGDKNLIAVLLMPIQIGSLIHEGQVIAIEFSDFPSQKKRNYTATVNSIDSEIILAGQVMGSAVQVVAPVQKVTALLHSQIIHPFGKDFKLRNGMKVTSTLTLKKESLASYVFNDLFNPQDKP